VPCRFISECVSGGEYTWSLHKSYAWFSYVIALLLLAPFIVLQVRNFDCIEEEEETRRIKGCEKGRITCFDTRTSPSLFADFIPKIFRR
jgi:hypothetical protein